MVGSAMAIDMVQNHEVLLTDINPVVLDKVLVKEPKLEVATLDVTDHDELRHCVEGCDLVICAVPGHLGFQALKALISLGKDVVDISFFPENALELRSLAEEHRVTAIVDCGVAPGMGNLMLGYHDGRMEVTHFECLVGGLPKAKKWPFQYKAPFSPVDVIEEYTRPARFIENSKWVTRPALTDVELVDFEKVGTLEAFNSDGLRSILYTMPHIPNRKEKTLRYPGHVEYIRVLQESGFFDTQEIRVNEQLIRPIDFTSSILFQDWKLGEYEEELTVMRVSIQGKDSHGQNVLVQYDLHDEFDLETRTSSMARTTGYTATAAAHLILNQIFAEKGVFPPELVGRHETCFNFVWDYLKQRGVIYKQLIKTLESD